MNIKSQLRLIAKSLSVIDDSDDQSINILCDPVNYYPQYITIKLTDTEYTLIKIKQCKQKIKSYINLSFSIIKMNKHYSRLFKDKYFEYQKRVNINELKQQLLYGQYNLDATTFEELYNIDINSFNYKDFKIYILSDKFKQFEVKKFIDSIYNIISNNILKKYARNIQFKNKLEQNRIAQITDGILEITDYNIHAFIHQIGHSIYEDIKYDQNKKVHIKFIYQHKQFPSLLCNKDISEFFAQLFAFYYIDKNKLTSYQIDLIDYIVYNKRIFKANIRIHHIYHNQIQNKVILRKRLININ